MEKKKTMKKLLAASAAIAVMLNLPFAAILPVKAAHPSGDSDPSATPPEVVTHHNHDDWTEWTGSNIESGGKYYLTDNVTIDTTIVIDNSAEVTLCLNGKNIILTDDGVGNGYFEVNNGTLNLCNCQKSTEVSQIQGCKKNGYSAIYISSSGTLNLCDITITGNTVRKDGSVSGGGGVGVTFGTFNMYSGTISNNKAEQDGGGVYVNGGTFNMYGGTISNNKADKRGGGVYVNSGEFTMKGGTIEQCVATTQGGGVYNTGTFTMSNSTISGNNATRWGGGVYNSGTFTMSDSTISNNTAASHGGGVYYDGGEFVIDGTTDIKTNTDGGNVYLTDSSSLITIGENFDCSANASKIGISVSELNCKTIPISKATDKEDALNAFFLDNNDDNHVIKNAEDTKIVINPIVVKHRTDKYSNYYSDATHHWKECYTCYEKVEIDEHVWGDTKINSNAYPTWDAMGEGLHECTVCGKSVKIEGIPALTDDTWRIADKISTLISANENGGNAYTSDKYGTFTTSSEVKHEWKVEFSQKPTTDATGTATLTCQNEPTHTKTQTVPKLSDDTVWKIVENKHVAPEVGKEGKNVYHSDLYGDVEAIIPALECEHEWGEWILSTKPTVGTVGEATRTCTKNNTHKETQPVSALSDEKTWTKVDFVTKPTLENKGAYKFKNDLYGEITAEVPALSDTTVWTKVTAECEAATETTTGKDVYSSVYGKVEVTIPAKTPEESSTTTTTTEEASTTTTAPEEATTTTTASGETTSTTTPAAEYVPIFPIDTETAATTPAPEEPSATTTPAPEEPSATTTTTTTAPINEPEPADSDFFPDIDLGSIEKKVEQKEDVPTANLATPVKELLQAIMPTEELAAIKETDNIKIILKIEDASETVPVEDKQQVEAALQENTSYTLGQYLDVTLLKIVNSSETKITNTNAPITVTFEVPEIFKKANRAFSVIRVHEGAGTVLNDLDNDPDTVTIETDRFSTYALAYTDKSGNPNTGVYVSIIPFAIAATSLGVLAIRKKSK